MDVEDFHQTVEALHVQAGLHARQQELDDAIRRRTRSFATTQAGLIISACIVAMTLMRIYVVSDGSLQTTLGILGTGTPLTVFVPLIFSIANAVAIGLPIWAATLAAMPEDNRRSWLQSRTRRFLFVAFASVPAIVFTPLIQLPLFGVFIVALFWAVPAQMEANFRTIKNAVAGDEGEKRRLQTLEPKGTFSFVVIGLVVVVAASSAISDRTMWLPKERFATPEGNFVAYEVADKDDEIVVIDDKTRTLKRIEKAAINDRSYCSNEQRLSLFQRVRHHATYPACDG